MASRLKPSDQGIYCRLWLLVLVEVRVTEPLFRTVAQLSILSVFSQVTGTLVDSVVSSVFAPFCTIPVLN